MRQPTVSHGTSPHQMAAPMPSTSTFHTVAMNNIARSAGMVRRAQWGAKPPKHPLEPDWNYDSIVIHYPAHLQLDTPQSIQTYDVDHNQWDDIAYHYVVAKDGQIFEGRQIVYKGSHVLKQNSGKIGIVCIGHYDASMLNWAAGVGYGGDKVGVPMLAAVRRLCRVLMGQFPIRTFGGHMEYGKTETCPGSNLLPYVKQLRTELKLAAPTFRTFE